MKILTKKEEVKRLLMQNEKYRNDYRELLARVWGNEIDDMVIGQSMQASTFLELLRSGKLSHPESIMRARRHIQRENPELAGNKAQRREEEQRVKEELGYTLFKI